MNRILKHIDLPGFLGGFREKGYVVLAPVERDGVVLSASPADGESVNLRFSNTRNAPKSAFFPRSERLCGYQGRGEIFNVSDASLDERPRLVFAARPCDAKSFVLMDRVFINDDFVDPYYAAKRKASLVFTLGCADPRPTCFCTSLGCAPFSTEGADVFMTDLGDGLLLEPFSEKGEKAVAELPGAGEAAAKKKKKELASGAEDRIASKVDVTGLPEKLQTIFEHPIWAEGVGAERCLGCGICAYLCPTCHCFDIQDETHTAGGQRVRNWDSCMFALFTLHGSGHNPRALQSQRWRQRVQHKFNYYVQNSGAMACVGCGRCVVNCPARIDIREILLKVMHAEET